MKNKQKTKNILVNSNKVLNLMILMIVTLVSCNQNSFYPEFESKLKEKVCKCVQIKANNDDDFLAKYEECQQELTSIITSGLNGYPEHAEISKEEYLSKLPKLIQELTNKCAKLN